MMLKENERSKLANYNQLLKLYSHLPYQYRATDTRVIFSFDKDGRSFSRLISKIHMFSCCPLVLLIKSNNNVTFGAYFENKPCPKSQKLLGSLDNFVFKLNPEFKVFNTNNKKNDYYFYCEDKNLYLGGGNEGAALYIGGDLTLGLSVKSDTFDNEPLHRYGTVWKKRDEFTIVEIELWLLC